MKSGRSAFFSGGACPPHTGYLCLCPPWGISIPVPFLVVLLFLLYLRLCPAPCGLVALLLLVAPYVWVEGGGHVPLFPLSLLRLCRRPSCLYFSFPWPVVCAILVVCGLQGLVH